jgi:regulatory protein
MDKDYQLLIDKALKLLSFRPRSKKEIQGRLEQLAIKKGISSKLVQKAIYDLEEKRLIDDKEFIKWWITQRETFRPKGQRLIKMELRNKGIETKTIDEVFEEKNKSGSNEFELALTLAQKRYQKFANLPKEELKSKLAALLGRRGFNWDTIYEVIDTILKKE